MSEVPFAELLGKDGPVRKAIQDQLGWGAWADVFCDALVARVTAQHVEDLVDKFGAHFVSYGETPSGGVTLNVRWKADRGFSCYHGATISEAYAALWAEVHRINTIKARYDHKIQPTDPGNATGPEIQPTVSGPA